MNQLARQLNLVAGGRPLREPGFAPCRRGWVLRRGVSRPAADSSHTASRLARLEAVLFLAKEALSSRRLAQLANLADGTETRTLVAQLNQRYDQRGSALEIESVAEGYRLLTRRQFAPWIGQLVGPAEQANLTGPALDTLAVVAYRQPVLRAEVEAIRGVGSGELLRQLIERDLLRIVGRSPELGRPLLYGTTKRFLQTFGLKSLDHLPHADQLRQAGTTQLDTATTAAMPNHLKAA